MRTINGASGGDIAATGRSEGFGQRFEDRLEVVAANGGLFGLAFQCEVSLRE